MSKEITSLYIHFPYCLSHCNYCDFYSVLKSTDDFSSFEVNLEKSFLKHEEFLKREGFQKGKLETLYLGGGTPSLWGTKGSLFFKNFLKKYDLCFEKNYEWTLEMNPSSLSERQLSLWEEAGVNRYSLGVQSLDPHFLKILGRAYDEIGVLKSLELLKGKNYSADLMLGLPEKNFSRNLKRELETLLEFGPKHLSVYILTVDDSYSFFKELPSEEKIAEEFLFVSEFLKNAGFAHYEVSNYAQASFKAQHNLKYWVSESVMSLGPTATGFLVDEGKYIRYKWDEQGNDFSLERLSNNEFKLERFYMLLRTSEGVRPSDFFSTAELEIYRKLLQDFQKKGWAYEDVGNFCLTAKGFLFLDSIMGEIFFSIKSF